MLSLPDSGRLVAGRYRLLDQLGRGAMGIVWRGRDELLDRDVAIKQIVLTPMASATQAQASYQRTIREARTAARLSHPGVVTVFDVVEEDGMPWIVMELIRARPLDQVIAEDGPLPPAQAAQLGLGLLDALMAAHAAGVLHRDVKPSNVLISPDGKAFLTDFGIATIAGDPGMTQAGMVVGTPGFSSPERVRGADATTASDLWSLGATLYAAVEGRGPFDRAGGSVAIVASIATEPAPRAPSAGPLAPVIEALLRADPATRPDAAATAKLLSHALELSRDGFRGARPAAVADQAGLDATTATQVVTVPGGAPAGSGRNGSALMAAIGQNGAGQPASAGAGEPGAARAGSPSGAAAQASGASSADPGEPADVVPDLMATPIFADLKMPPLQADLPNSPDSLGPLSAATEPGPADGSTSPGASTFPLQGKGGPTRSRRGLVIIAPAAVSAVVAGAVFLAFPSVGDSLIHKLSHLATGSGTGSTSNAQSGGLGRHAGHRSPGSAGSPGQGARTPTPTSGKPTATPTPSGSHHRSGRPTPSGTPTNSGTPSPSGSPSATPSPSPSPTPSPSPSLTALPPGYIWQSESAPAGAVAGFKVATLATWLMYPGLNTYFAPLAGIGRLGVNMSPFTATWPVKEAKHLQAAAIAHNRYPGYHLVSILAMKYHGVAAATWVFSWKQPVSGRRIDVTEVLFTAKTSLGSQPYDLSMAAPAAHSAWASHVFRIALRTFTPIP